MSVVKYVTLYCDHGYTGHAGLVMISSTFRPCRTELATHSESVPDARKVAQAHGWTRPGGRDICPQHPDGDATL